MPHVRIRKSTIDKLRRKQENLSRFLGKKVPITQIMDSMASKPLMLDDTELRNLKRWKKKLI